jgi:hypothetical protein
MASGGSSGTNGHLKGAVAPKRNFASRVFGYDLFISFALGPPPRGPLSYASDLARRLRELDFTVFFSEDEAAPGEQLDSTLLKALYRSRTVVVIANRGTLQELRWVRQEVEAFSSRHPDRPIIPIRAHCRTRLWPSRRGNGWHLTTRSGWTSPMMQSHRV